jgi:hypothetical protein
VFCHDIVVSNQNLARTSCALIGIVVSALFNGVEAIGQFSQPQTFQGSPLVPTIPSQSFAGAPESLGSRDDTRSDSNLLGVRSLNTPTNFIGGGSDAFSNVPTSTRTSGLNEPQQSLSLPALPGRQPPFGQNEWQTANPTTPQGFLSPSNLSPSNPGGNAGAPVSPWPVANFGSSSNSNFVNPTGLVPQTGGEMVSPSNRFLAQDQPSVQRSTQSTAQKQAEVAQWIPRIDASVFTDSGLRQGRSNVKGRDGLDEQYSRSQDSGLSDQASAIVGTLTGGSGKQSGVGDDNTNDTSRPEKSMDTLSWWLMMCSVMINLVLFYFLYDSRAKYLNLADELQSRFFREG